MHDDPETQRLREDELRERNWKRWGPYLAERQWGTVREDYSHNGESWHSFTHDQARSRAYRWGEDGLLGFCDRQGRMCFALALWNEHDPILKERLFGLTGPEGNHGEDVKEAYFYLDSTPTHSYAEALYKYPQQAYPYAELVQKNAARGRAEPELELSDLGAFDGEQYFDVYVRYAKAAPEDLLIEIKIRNPSSQMARLHVLPSLWFRNTWSWGRGGEGYWRRPVISRHEAGLKAEHEALGTYFLHLDTTTFAGNVECLFTENETNNQKLWGVPNAQPYVKDAFHRYVVNGDGSAINPSQRGTKAAFRCAVEVTAQGECVLRLRLHAAATVSTLQPAFPFGDFDEIMQRRRTEADLFYASRMHPGLTRDENRVTRQAYAGLLWTKQFYFYDVQAWLDGDPAHPTPPESRKRGRNADWKHLYNRDILSMPDKWEYPWFAAWDSAFHMIPFARIDPFFAKEQLLLFLREWYMHPNGQMPAYEYGFDDVNPPVHAWASWRIYKLAVDTDGQRDRHFLAKVFQKLLLNFTWWVNRKDAHGRNLFSGGFLGLDNIGVFDRSKPLPMGGHLEQADGTAWMAFYAATMLSIALELASFEPAYEDMASKFFEHFVAIASAINHLGGSGLWDDEDGFYYDKLHAGEATFPMRVRSMVGLLPLIAVEILDESMLARLPRFRRRMQWFIDNRPLLGKLVTKANNDSGLLLLAIPSQTQLAKILSYVLDETEFLSPHGVRSLSKHHEREPYRFVHGRDSFSVKYVPGDSDTGLFGGNSNWRGPVWLPVNYLLTEALERYHKFYGNDFTIECPTGSGQRFTLVQVAEEIERRVASLFLLNEEGRRPCHGTDEHFANAWRDLVLFHEYFHAEDGRGLGASHQTGWTALAIRFIEDAARTRK
ncbi:MAG: glucosidase [Deltaproteobacteria bacterium]|nr:glucosidase [Deltaproteobacteria bacterium]